MKKTVGIFGGDDRQCYLAEELSERGIMVWGWELGSQGGVCPVLPHTGKIKVAENFSELAENCQVLAGAVPFSRYLLDKENFGNTLCACLRAGQHFFAGGIGWELSDALKNKGVQVTDYLKEKDFLEKNAKLTAQGCVLEVLKLWKKKMQGAKVLVTGFGFCGREIARVMRGIGADVTVCVRRMQSAWEAYEEGFAICYYEQLESFLPQMGIVVNTVPALVFPENRLRCAREDTIFIEIASAPGGFSPEMAAQFGLTVKVCPGLPGKYAPIGAAQAMADCMEDDLEL